MWRLFIGSLHARAHDEPNDYVHPEESASVCAILATVLSFGVYFRNSRERLQQNATQHHQPGAL